VAPHFVILLPAMTRLALISGKSLIIRITLVTLTIIFAIITLITLIHKAMVATCFVILPFLLLVAIGVPHFSRFWLVRVITSIRDIRVMGLVGLFRLFGLLLGLCWDATKVIGIIRVITVLRDVRVITDILINSLTIMTIIIKFYSDCIQPQQP
jgi:hypothetical protein